MGKNKELVVPRLLSGRARTDKSHAGSGLGETCASLSFYMKIVQVVLVHPECCILLPNRGSTATKEGVVCSAPNNAAAAAHDLRLIDASVYGAWRVQVSTVSQWRRHWTNHVIC